MIAVQEATEIRLLQHVLFGLVLLGRLGDVLSTRLVTPKLALEANPLVRRLGWKFAVLTVLICFVPYLDWRLGVMLVPPFLMISGSNVSKIWMARAQGEQQTLENMMKVARQSTFGSAAACALTSASFFALTGLVLVLLSLWEPHFYGRPSSFASQVGQFFGYGIMTFGLAIGLHGTLYLRRIFAMAANVQNAPEEM